MMYRNELKNRSIRSYRERRKVEKERLKEKIISQASYKTKLEQKLKRFDKVTKGFEKNYILGLVT